MNTIQSEKYCITVAIAGEPNVGKSTIVNLISGKDVSIATSKPQTTRFNVKGIYNDQSHQIVFVDTPGVFKFKGRSGLEKYIIANAWSGIRSAEKMIIVVDPNKKLFDGFKYLQSELERSEEKAILVINKIDTTTPEELGAFEESIPNKDLFEKTFRLSAKADIGVVPLIDYLKEISPKAQWIFNQGEVTDLDLSETFAEITRKQIFLNFKQEIPYSSKVETVLISEPKQVTLSIRAPRAKSIKKIDDLFDDDIEENVAFVNEEPELKTLNIIEVVQNIIVDKDNHKKIVIGKQGAMLTTLLKEASAEMQSFLADGSRVKLKLIVKVKPNWQDKLRV
jgi:GTPase